MISKLPTQGLPLDLRTAYFHRVWGKDESIILSLTPHQQQALKLYYGLLGETPHRVNEIKALTGSKNHSITRSLCLRAFIALRRNKRKAVCEQLGIVTKEIPPQLRGEYMTRMYPTLELIEGNGKIPLKAMKIFQAYYAQCLSVEEIAFRYQLPPTQVLKNISNTEDILVENAHAKISENMFQEWLKVTKRYCPNCFSTNVSPIFSRGRRNGLRCFECHKPVLPAQFGLIRLA
jgi:hypothetical protein